MTTTRVTQHKSAPAYGFKVLDEAAGTFEAIVSVFDNVDLGGEVVKAGAFNSSIETWRKSGDPIPVIFSHQWDNLDAHVGTADPNDVKELLPGDPLLPAELADLGGLYVKAQMETSEDFAGRLWKRMSSRAIKEFSFAYDVVKAKPSATTGAKLDLLELDLIEVGPTLKGMNPATALLAAKARGAKAGELSPLDVLELADELVADVHDELLATAQPKRIPADGLVGAIENTLNAVRESATIWAELEYGRDLYAVHLEGTFLDDGKAIITAERWEDPYNEGPVWELAYTLNDDGTVTIDGATALEVTTELAPARDARSAGTLAGMVKIARGLSGDAGGSRATVPPTHDGKAEEHDAKAEDLTARNEDGDLELSPLAALVEADTLTDSLS